MHLFNLDTILYKMYKNKWKLEEEEKLIPTFTPPKLWKLNFLEKNENSSELYLFKYPSHYKHKKVFQYDSGFQLYFSLIGSLFLFKAVRDFRKQSFKSFAFFTFLSSITFLEGHVISSRVRDVKKVTLKDGKVLCINTFQDGEMQYQIDLKDLRIVNKDKANLLILLDVNMAKDKNFKFFFLEPSPGCVYNMELLNTVLVDKRYLEYNFS